MKQLLLFATLLFTELVFGQTLNSLMYYPDGKKYKGTAKTIGELNKQLEKRGRVYVYNPFPEDNFTMVGYKLFTDKPLWVMTEDTAKILPAAKSLGLDEFFQSSMFEIELQSAIKKRVLDDAFILETLGQPQQKEKYFDKDIALENWKYTSLGLSLTLKSGIVISYIKIE